MVDSSDQSRVRVTAMVESSEELRSFDRVGKQRFVTVEEWCSSVPSSRFLLFSRMGRFAIVLSSSWSGVVLELGGCAEM